MSTTAVRYTVKPGRAAENQALIERVFEQLARATPAGLRYAAFREGDGLSFVHLVAHDPAAGGDPLATIAAFGEFTAGIHERCAEPPVVARLTVVGSYGWSGG